MKIITPYDYKNRPRPRTIFKDPHMTEQAHKDTCDINRILKDYQKTGFIEHSKKHEGQYDDVSSMDFESAMNTVANVKSMFEGLPSTYRSQFGNNPSNFLEFVQNPDNHAQMQQMGILKGNDGINIKGAAVKSPVEAVQAQNAPTEASQGETHYETQPASSES